MLPSLVSSVSGSYAERATPGMGIFFHGDVSPAESGCHLLEKEWALNSVKLLAGSQRKGLVVEVSYIRGLSKKFVDCF